MLERPVRTEEGVDKASRERSEAADLAMGLLAILFFSHLHALLVNSSLYSLNDVRLLEWNTNKQLQFTASTLPLVFAFFWRRVIEPLHTE